MINSQSNVKKIPKTQAERFWEIKASKVPADDPLLGCLVILTRVEHRPFTAEALSMGLPLVDNRLTPELFVRAAKRANLSASLVHRKLSEISPLVLPVVLLMKHQGACLLVGIKKEGVYQIIQPETGDGIHEVKHEHLEKEYIGYALFIKPSYQFDQRTEEEHLKRPKSWFWSVMRGILPLYGEILIASFMVNLFALGSPLFVMNVYDRVVPNNAVETLWVLAVGMGAVYLFDFIIKTLRAYFIDIAGKKADILLSARIYEQIMGIKMEARPESVGAFVNNMTQFDSFREFMTSTTITALIDLPFVVLFIIVIFYIGGSLAFVPLIAIPIVLVVSFVIQFPLNRLVKESYRYAAQKQASLIETLIGVETIKGICAESPMQRRWENIIGLASMKNIKIKILTMLANHFSMFVQQAAGIALIVVGVYHISEGLITMGALIASNMLSSRVLAPLVQVVSLITRYEQSMTALNSVDRVMKMPVERPIGKVPLYRDTIDGNIGFKEVSLKYPNQDLPALDKVTFSIKAGEKVGIIGRIGSGKTSIEKLLMGLYTPTTGSILLDGTEIGQIDPACLRKNIGYVPQDIMLFYGSIRDNITLGAPYANDQSIMRASSISGVTEFVAQHPKGFDWIVGERGEKLSGGQRQSLAVARALLLDPPILLLDEPTNMMDARSEELFKHKLAQIINNKTVLLVSHKASMLSLVDRLLLIENGKLVADGPRDQLLKSISEGTVQVEKHT